MSDDSSSDNKSVDSENFIQFKIDRPFRMFVGKIEGNIVEKISKEELEGFKDGDKVVVMHGEDWLWFIDELLKRQQTN